jgi:Domain of unknown function (DUF6089)
MLKRCLLFLFIVLPLFADAQRRSRYRYEVGVGIGVSNFLGELGGANQIGTNGLRDLEFSLTRPSFSAFLRYRKARFFGYRAAFSYGKVSGYDGLTEEIFRNNRNIHFKSNIFEFSTQFEFYFTKERPGHLYKYKGVTGLKNIDMQVYAFSGIATFWFNPKANYNGTWYALQPLATEGQTLKPGTKKYSRVSVAIPIGIGFKNALDRRWSIGLEFGIRKTFTDYIDDVSTTYYDKNAIAAAFGPAAGYFADPSLNLIPRDPGFEVTGIGQQRGDSSDNDSYLFAHVTVSYKIGRFRRTKSKF